MRLSTKVFSLAAIAALATSPAFAASRTEPSSLKTLTVSTSTTTSSSTVTTTATRCPTGALQCEGPKTR